MWYLFGVMVSYGFQMPFLHISSLFEKYVTMWLEAKLIYSFLEKYVMVIVLSTRMSLLHTLKGKCGHPVLNVMTFMSYSLDY